MNLDKKKATDLTTSAPTDMNQSLHPNTNIIPNSQQIINKNILETLSLNEIYDTVFQPKSQIIEGMLQTGAYLFVGAPKIGKSFLMAQIGYYVSKGISLWNFKTYQGTVLYLALEDDYSRIQQRLCRRQKRRICLRYGYSQAAKRRDGLLSAILSHSCHGAGRERVRTWYCERV